jgi:hypothetical protein
LRLSCTNSIGILDREDVLVAIVVDEVDHRRQGRRLAGARGPGHQHQAARHHADIAEHLPHAEVLHGQDLRGNGTEDAAGAAVLVEGVDPEARDARYLEGEVRLQELLEVLALLVVHDVVHQIMNLLVLKRRQVDAANVAVDADHGRQPGREVQIRCALFGAERQQFGDIHGACCVLPSADEVAIAWRRGAIRYHARMGSDQIPANIAKVLASVSTAAEKYGREPERHRHLAVSKTQPAAGVRAAAVAGCGTSARTTCRKRRKRSAPARPRPVLALHRPDPVEQDAAHRRGLRLGAQRRSREDPPAPQRAASDAHLPPLNICLQVNISGEASKAGVGRPRCPRCSTSRHRCPACACAA